MLDVFMCIKYFCICNLITYNRGWNYTVKILENMLAGLEVILQEIIVTHLKKLLVYASKFYKSFLYLLQ